jgi:hypothetical protein
MVPSDLILSNDSDLFPYHVSSSLLANMDLKAFELV